MDMDDDESWLQTYTGRAFYPFAPRSDDVDIEDIAHSLSNQCRFSGHCQFFYSVAEHSVRVATELSSLVGDEPSLCSDLLAGLLHDAAEAYLVDLPRPLKRHIAFAAYAVVEKRVESAVAAKFNLPGLSSSSIKLVDTILLATEARDLMPNPPRDWKLEAKPLPERIEPWTSEKAKAEFLAMFRRLWTERESLLGKDK